MSRHIKVVGVAAMSLLSTGAGASDWAAQPATAEHGIVLTFAAGEPVSYRFECTARDVIAKQTGITKLIDLTSGKPIGDDAAAVMPPGAAMMALFAGKGNPQFAPAEAAKNPAGGWDLTLHVAKDDKQLKAIGKSDMMSLFTTGYTMAVAMDGAARGRWNDFLKRCQAGG